MVGCVDIPACGTHILSSSFSPDEIPDDSNCMYDEATGMVRMQWIKLRNDGHDINCHTVMAFRIVDKPGGTG